MHVDAVPPIDRIASFAYLPSIAVCGMREYYLSCIVKE